MTTRYTSAYLLRSDNVNLNTTLALRGAVVFFCIGLIFCIAAVFKRKAKPDNDSAS